MGCAVARAASVRPEHRNRSATGLPTHSGASARRPRSAHAGQPRRAARTRADRAQRAYSGGPVRICQRLSGRDEPHDCSSSRSAAAHCHAANRRLHGLRSVAWLGCRSWQQVRHQRGPRKTTVARSSVGEAAGGSMVSDPDGYVPPVAIIGVGWSHQITDLAGCRTRQAARFAASWRQSWPSRSTVRCWNGCRGRGTPCGHAGATRSGTPPGRRRPRRAIPGRPARSSARAAA